MTRNTTDYQADLRQNNTLMLIYHIWVGLFRKESISFISSHQLISKALHVGDDNKARVRKVPSWGDSSNFVES